MHLSPTWPCIITLIARALWCTAAQQLVSSEAFCQDFTALVACSSWQIFTCSQFTFRHQVIWQERKSVKNEGLILRRLTGDDLTPAIWDQFYVFYRNTTGADKAFAVLQQAQSSTRQHPTGVTSLASLPAASNNFKIWLHARMQLHLNAVTVQWAWAAFRHGMYKGDLARAGIHGTRLHILMHATIL